MLNKIDKVLTHVENAITGSLLIGLPILLATMAMIIAASRGSTSCSFSSPAEPGAGFAGAAGAAGAAAAAAAAAASAAAFLSCFSSACLPFAWLPVCLPLVCLPLRLLGSVCSCCAAAPA